MVYSRRRVYAVRQASLGDNPSEWRLIRVTRDADYSLPRLNTSPRDWHTTGIICRALSLDEPITICHLISLLLIAWLRCHPVMQWQNRGAGTTLLLFGMHCILITLAWKSVFIFISFQAGICTIESWEPGKPVSPPVCIVENRINLSESITSAWKLFFEYIVSFICSWNCCRNFDL